MTKKDKLSWRVLGYQFAMAIEELVYVTTSGADGLSHRRDNARKEFEGLVQTFGELLERIADGTSS